MRKIGIILITAGLTILAFFSVYNYAMKQRQQNDIQEYIEETSISDENIEDNNEEVEEPKKESNTSINYTAVLEIPKINLKSGVVNNTRGFRSINYSISVDNSSKYPNENGNFILYAHSGNSNISFFRNLNKVDINDDVYVYHNGIKYHYVIYQKYDIEKTGKAKVISTDKDKLITLITCNQSRKGYQVVEVGKLVEELNY